MMMTTKIRKGSEIPTMGYGYEIVTGFNGHIVYTDSYEINDDGSSIKVGERMLTLSEIGDLLKQVDRYNHRVVFEEDEEEEE